MNLLLATDGSDGANAAAQFVACFAPYPDTRLHLLAILPDDLTASECDKEAERLFAAIRASLEGFAGSVSATPTQTRLSTGRIVERIQVAAEMMPADLVITGSRGHSSLARFFLGSVARCVARHAPCSVLIGCSPHGALDRVVVGVDDTDDSLIVTRFVRRLPLPPGCVIHLVYVAISDALADHSGGLLPDPLRRTIAAAVDEAQAEGRVRMDEAACELRACGFHVSTQMRYGDPASELLDAVGSGADAADLLVVGVRRFSSLGEYFLGSMSSALIESANCAVLVVRR